MDAKFSQRIKDVLTYSKEEAIRLRNSNISNDHLFLGILREGEGIAIDLLASFDIDKVTIKKYIENKIRNTDNSFEINLETKEIPLLKSSENALKLVYLEARSLKSKTIDTGHLLLAILRDETCWTALYLNEQGVDYYSIKEQLRNDLPKSKSDFPDDQGE